MSTQEKPFYNPYDPRSKTGKHESYDEFLLELQEWNKSVMASELPTSLLYLKTLLPVAKQELLTVQEVTGHEPPILNRLVEKLEQLLNTI